MSRHVSQSPLPVSGFWLPVVGCRSLVTRHSRPGHRSLVTGHCGPDDRLPITAHGLSRPSGFTLLELIIVMALIGLLLGFSSLFIASNLPSARLSAIAREISATVMLARAQAETQGKTQTLTINLDAREYNLEGRARRTLPPDVTVRVTDPFFGEMEQGMYTLRFEPYGPHPAASILIRNPARQLVVELDPVAGAVVRR